MAKREKRPTWWKMFYHQRAVLESINDSDVGQGLKAAFRYFDGEKIDPADISPAAFTAFSAFRPYIDEARESYDERVQRGRESQE